jgi:hypothetical protein
MGAGEARRLAHRGPPGVLGPAMVSTPSLRCSTTGPAGSFGSRAGRSAQRVRVEAVIGADHHRGLGAGQVQQRAES